MKSRSTLILIVLGAALAAYLYFYDRYQKSSEEVAGDATRIAIVDRDKINSISIRNPEGKIELRKHDDAQWYMEEPVKDRADSTVVAQLFTGIETFRSENSIPLDKGKEQLKEYGISDSNTKARFTGSDKPVEIIFGKDTAVKGKIYVYVDGSDKVYAAGNELKNQITKKGDDFRDRKLTDLTPQKVTKLQIKSTAGELELAKKNNHWSLVKPMVARGDDSKINDLISQLTTAHIDQFLSDTQPGHYGLSEPRGTLTFTVEGSDKPVVLQVGGNPKEEKDKEKLYVKLSTRDGGHAGAEDRRECAQLQTERSARSKPGAGGERHRRSHHSRSPAARRWCSPATGESWVRKEGDKDVPMNVSAAARVLSELQGAQVIDFVSDVASDLPKYGLDQPQAKVTFSSYASQNTAETKAGEKPIVQVLFGKSADDKNDKVYARLDDEPFIVTVPSNILEAVPKNAVELQDLAITNFKAEEVSNLEVTVGSQAPLSLERQKEGTWKLTKGEGTLTQPSVLNLANALAGLRAVRWEGPARPEYGFEHPLATVAYTVTRGDQKTPGKLTIGTSNAEGLAYAQAEGLTGVFLMAKTDFDAFVAPLTDKQTAPPAAVAPALSAPSPTPAPAESGAPVPTPDARTGCSRCRTGSACRRSRASAGCFDACAASSRTDGSPDSSDTCPCPHTSTTCGTIARTGCSRTDCSSGSSGSDRCSDASATGARTGGPRNDSSSSRSGSDRCPDAAAPAPRPHRCQLLSPLRRLPLPCRHLLPRPLRQQNSQPRHRLPHRRSQLPRPYRRLPPQRLKQHRLRFRLYPPPRLLRPTLRRRLSPRPSRLLPHNRRCAYPATPRRARALPRQVAQRRNPRERYDRTPRNQHLNSSSRPRL